MTDLVRMPEKEEEYAVIERLDEAQIVAEMRGELLTKKYAYSFRSGGELVVDLSVYGYAEFTRSLGGVSTELVEFSDSPERVVVVCKATDLVRNFAALGGGEQVRRLPNNREEPFAVAKAVSKAQRNAWKRLLPMPAIQAILKRYLEQLELEERDLLLVGIPTRMSEYKYSMEKLIAHIGEKYAKESLEELELKELKEVSALVVTARGKQLLS